MSTQEDSNIKKTTLKRLKNKVKGSKVVDWFVVYVVSLEDEILYIGSGHPSRHHHVTSGCSHVYELNKLHFQNKIVDVKIVYQTNNKQESLDVEKQLIALRKPLYNTVYNTDKVSKMKNMLHDKWSAYFKTFDKRKCDRFTKILNEAVNCFGINALTTGKGVYIRGLVSRKLIPHCITALFTAHRKETYEHFRELHEIMCINEGYLFLPDELPVTLLAQPKVRSALNKREKRRLKHFPKEQNETN
jgi:hypothetical protein